MAAGLGRRFDDQVPKQFHLINGKPLIFYSLKAFFDFNPNIKIILVLNKKWFTHWNEMCASSKMNIPHLVVEGGESRSESVSKALNEVPDSSCVMIHDAARPCLKLDLIERLYKGFLENGNAVPSLPVTNAIRKVTAGKSEWLDRDLYHNIQTPQVFLSSDLKKALRENMAHDCFDESELMEKNGNPIFTVLGDPINIKVTYPLDIQLAGLILSN